MVQHCAAQLRKRTSQTEVMHNVHALTQNDAVRMMLWVTTHKVMVYDTMTWQWLYWSSFLIGTTANECVTAWRQWHNADVMVPVVVLCTTGSRHALVRRLKLVQSSLLQYRDTKRSKRKRDAYKWYQEDSYPKEIHKSFVWWSEPSGWDGQLFLKYLIGLRLTIPSIPQL